MIFGFLARFPPVMIEKSFFTKEEFFAKLKQVQSE
jgi:hypothetical protein